MLFLTYSRLPASSSFTPGPLFTIRPGDISAPIKPIEYYVRTAIHVAAIVKALRVFVPLTGCASPALSPSDSFE